MYRRFVVYCIGALTALTALTSVAQDRDPIAPVPVQAAFRAVRARNPTLSQVVKAKYQVADKKQHLIIMLPSYRMEKREGTMMVTTTRVEQRTRTIVVNGEQKEQSYTVSVPVRKRVTDPIVPVPAGQKPSVFDADKFQIYDVAGNRLESDELAKRLGKLSSIFLLERYTGEFTGVPEPQRSILHPDAVVATTAEVIHKRRPEIQESKPSE